jgi:hypothetical protein
LLTTSPYYFAAPDAPSKTSECEFGKHLFRKEEEVKNFVKAHNLLVNNTSDDEEEEEEEEIEGIEEIVDCENASDEEEEDYNNMPFAELWKKLKQQG